MFTADVAPEWMDGEVCHRCRVTFSLTQRKHHCRCCGQVFCHTCSSRTSRIPKYGYEKEVRVCDGCYIVLQKPAHSVDSKKTEDTSLPEEYLKSSLAQQPQLPPSKTEQEIQEEEELQLALALSQSEAEEKAKLNSTWQAQTYRARSPSHQPAKRSPSPEMEMNNPELSRYLNRNYWEQKNNSNQIQQKDSPSSPTAPSPMSSIDANNIPIKFSVDDPEMDEFVVSMQRQLEIFVSRMKSSLARGRNINNDTSIQSIFLNISSLHSKLLTYIKELDEKRMWYESLQDKIGQIKDSRAALDVLRQEHQEKLRQIAEEQERQRQIQMAQKLDIMRKKKQEYLQYQRQLALQRIQEQEREMQLRQEQQKAIYRMSNQGGYGSLSEQNINPALLMSSGQYYNVGQPNMLGNQSFGGHYLPPMNSGANQQLTTAMPAPIPMYPPNAGQQFQNTNIPNSSKPLEQSFNSLQNFNMHGEIHQNTAASNQIQSPPVPQQIGPIMGGQQIGIENSMQTIQQALPIQQPVTDVAQIQQPPPTQPPTDEANKKETAIGELISFD